MRSTRILPAVALLGLLGIAACGSDDAASLTPAATASSTSAGSPAASTTACQSPQSGPDSFKETVAMQPATADGLQMGDVKAGSGPAVQTGQQVSVQYTGWLTDGTKFDSSRDRGQPFQFAPGSGVIQGWSEGVVGMKLCGKRRLVIPASLGYGAQGQPPTIPANATLVFDVEVVSIP